MIEFLLALLGLWVGGGLWLLWRGSRGSDGSFQREATPIICTVGEQIDVTLRLAPPQLKAQPDSIEDQDIVLAIDNSSSMGSRPGSPLREALRAAENFFKRLPDSIHTGVVKFDQEAHLVSPITAGHATSLRAVRSIGGGGGTAINLALDCCREALLQGRSNVKKVVILLSDGGSDHDASLLSANRLRQEVPDVSVICVGFGAVNETLMRAVADSPEKYLHVSKPEDLYRLFSFLASAVSGQIPVSGMIEESAWTPHPFRLTSTGGYYPLGVGAANPTRIIWSLPILGGNEPPLTYGLATECPGWHAVAAPESRAVWRMPDGTEQKEIGPAGPKVLILPWWMRWAWPIFNPIFWTLFGRWWPCSVAVTEKLSVPEPTPLPSPSFPALPPPPQIRPYDLRVRPALVIGLGESGEWTVSRLKNRLEDRGVTPQSVETVAIHVSHHANRLPVSVGRTQLEASGRVELPQDFRPYLESLRNNGAPPTRSWIPWRRWLADTHPQTTVRLVTDDRRKARLALLLSPGDVEQRLATSLSRIVREDGLVIVVGSPDDAECSGLMAEVAHLCASQGAGVTAVFAPALTEREPSTAALALTQEMERMLLMRGHNIISDRRNPPVVARRLFDRIIVCDQKQPTPENASLRATELIWAMIAYQDVLKQFPLTRDEGDEVICCVTSVDGRAIPAGNLWRWAREHTLAQGVNGRWLGLREQEGRFVLPKPDQSLVDGDVESFWTGSDSTRPMSRLLASSRSFLQAAKSSSISDFTGLQDELPAEKLYHEQVAYSENERRNFNAYLEEWLHRILEREQRKGDWGLATLMSALLRVEDDCRSVLKRLQRQSANPNFANSVNLASALYTDFLAVISVLRRDLASWIARFAGPQLELGADPMPANTPPVCEEIEMARQAAEDALTLTDPEARDSLKAEFNRWFLSTGQSLLGQLRFSVSSDRSNQRSRIKLWLEEGKEVGSDESPLPQIRQMLNRYQNQVFDWPFDAWMRPENVPDPHDHFRIGKHSGRLFPRVERIVDEGDPFVATAIKVKELPLKVALGVAAPLFGELPYAWPEEANAGRISEKIRNRLKRNPESFSPLVIHLLRDTQKLYQFFSDLAVGQVIAGGAGFILKRDNREYQIGPKPERLRGLEAFQNVAQQVVAWEISINGEPIAPPLSPQWQAAPEDALRAVEAHPLAREAMSAPEWKMWQDVIRGLALEYGS